MNKALGSLMSCREALGDGSGRSGLAVTERPRRANRSESGPVLQPEPWTQTLRSGCCDRMLCVGPLGPPCTGGHRGAQRGPVQARRGRCFGEHGEFCLSGAAGFQGLGRGECPQLLLTETQHWHKGRGVDGERARGFW